MALPSYWPSHTSVSSGALAPGHDLRHPLEARRCTVQLSTGRLYLDAVASPATALSGMTCRRCRLPMSQPWNACCHRLRPVTFASR